MISIEFGCSNSAQVSPFSLMINDREYPVCTTKEDFELLKGMLKDIREMSDAEFQDVMATLDV